MEENNNKDLKKEKSSKPRLSLNKNKKALEEVKEELKELEDKYLRLFAEFENYKKRVRKENETLITTASENVMWALLPVIDDFKRAKKASDDENSTEHFSEGVNLVYEKFSGILKNLGLEEMEVVGLEFNSEEHEAIADFTVEDSSMKGKIIDVIEGGYKLNSKIIRFPKVVVGK